MNLDPRTTALVLIDLQRGIVSRLTEPYAASDVIARAARLAAAFRDAHAPVVLVNVTYAADDGDRVKTIVIGGISTNFGVESTARDAWERNYALVFAEDACASFNGAAHAFAFDTIFPRLGVRSTTLDIIHAIH